MSMKPGQTTRPFTSTTSAPRAGRGGPSSSIAALREQHVEGRVDALRGVDDAPALQQQPAHAGRLRAPAEQQVQHRHPHRDAVRHLVEDHRVRARPPPRSRSRPRGSSGPGCMTSTSFFARRTRSSVSPKRRWYSRVVGKKPPRHALELDAQHHHDVRALHRLVDPVASPGPAARSPGGISVGGPHSTTDAPIFASSQRFERATRLCRMSPTIATRRPFSRPFFWRIVRASSSACVGCSWAPSPAFTTEKRQWRARKCGAPGARVAHDDHVGVHRLEVPGGVEQGLALGDARGGGRRSRGCRRRARARRSRTTSACGSRPRRTG